MSEFADIPMTQEQPVEEVVSTVEEIVEEEVAETVEEEVPQTVEEEVQQTVEEEVAETVEEEGDEEEVEEPVKKVQVSEVVVNDGINKPYILKTVNGLTYRLY